jgi:hypothetical protein
VDALITRLMGSPLPAVSKAKQLAAAGVLWEQLLRKLAAQLAAVGALLHIGEPTHELDWVRDQKRPGHSFRRCTAQVQVSMPASEGGVPASYTPNHIFPASRTPGYAGQQPDALSVIIGAHACSTSSVVMSDVGEQERANLEAGLPQAASAALWAAAAPVLKWVVVWQLPTSTQRAVLDDAGSFGQLLVGPSMDATVQLSPSVGASALGLQDRPAGQQP